MYIISSDRDLIVNTNTFAIGIEQFIGNKYRICAYDAKGESYTLGAFYDIEKAESIMKRIFDCISVEWNCFDMKDDI